VSGYVGAVASAVVLGALLVSFAAFITTHIVIAVRLLVSAKPRYRGIVAFVVLPLAPMWAYRERWRWLCWTWIGSVAAYAAMVAVSSFVN
jgi:hypothetical protein